MFCLFNNYLEEYLSNELFQNYFVFIYFFNSLFLTPYSYPKKQLRAPMVVILTKYTVVCKMPFNGHMSFLFF